MKRLAPRGRQRGQSPSLVHWILVTARKMGPAKDQSGAAWSEAWFATYLEFGGKSASTGRKGCPRAAAYALWRLGRIRGSGIHSNPTDVVQVLRDFGRNGAYAVIAADLLVEEGSSSSLELWPGVRRRFKLATGQEASGSDQGAAKMAISLFESGDLAPRV